MCFSARGATEGRGLGLFVYLLFSVCVCVCVCVNCLVMSDSLQPHRPSPPGPSIHGILQARTLEWVAISSSKRNYRKKESEFPQSCPTFETHGLQPTRLLCPWDFPGKSPGVGCHCYLVFAPEKGPCKFPKPYWL